MRGLIIVCPFNIAISVAIFEENVLDSTEYWIFKYCNIVTSDAIYEENLFLVRRIFVLDQRVAEEDSVEDGWGKNIFLVIFNQFNQHVESGNLKRKTKFKLFIMRKSTLKILSSWGIPLKYLSVCKHDVGSPVCDNPSDISHRNRCKNQNRSTWAQKWISHLKASIALGTSREAGQPPPCFKNGC